MRGGTAHWGGDVSGQVILGPPEKVKLSKARGASQKQHPSMASASLPALTALVIDCDWKLASGNKPFPPQIALAMAS